jgi:hypothetical protein
LGDQGAAIKGQLMRKKKRVIRPAPPEVWELMVSHDGVAAPLDALVSDDALRQRFSRVGNTRFRIALRYAVSLGAQSAERKAAYDEISHVDRTRSLRDSRAARQTCFEWEAQIDAIASSMQTQEAKLLVPEERAYELDCLHKGAWEKVLEAEKALAALCDAVETIVEDSPSGATQKFIFYRFVSELANWWRKSTGYSAPRGDDGPFVRLISAGMESIVLAHQLCPKGPLDAGQWKDRSVNLGPAIRRALKQPIRR